MSLDIKFRKLLERELEKSLGVIDNDNTDLKKIWGCKHNGDFLHGWHIGRADDFCMNQYFLYYHKAPTREDVQEIQGILHLHSKEFLNRLTKTQQS